MKKLFGLLTTLVLALTLVACGGGTVLVEDGVDYYVTGPYHGWGDATKNPEYQMEAISINDSRVASIKSELNGATALYVFELTFPNNVETWENGYTIDGVERKFNGSMFVKLIQTPTGEEIPNYWLQSPESGEVKNLTPNNLYIAPFRPESENTDGRGWSNSDPANLVGPGTFYVVFARLPNNVKAMGIIAK
jgi:hypothetical protein